MSIKDWNELLVDRKCTFMSMWCFVNLNESNPKSVANRCILVDGRLATASKFYRGQSSDD